MCWTSPNEAEEIRKGPATWMSSLKSVGEFPRQRNTSSTALTQTQLWDIEDNYSLYKVIQVLLFMPSNLLNHYWKRLQTSQKMSCISESVVFTPWNLATRSPQNSSSSRTHTMHPESSATVQACNGGFGFTNNSRKN